MGTQWYVVRIDTDVTQVPPFVEWATPSFSKLENDAPYDGRHVIVASGGDYTRLPAAIRTAVEEYERAITDEQQGFDTAHRYDVVGEVRAMEDRARDLCA